MKNETFAVTPLGLLESINLDVRALSADQSPLKQKQLVKSLSNRIKQLSVLLRSE